MSKLQRALWLLLGGFALWVSFIAVQTEWIGLCFITAFFAIAMINYGITAD